MAAIDIGIQAGTDGAWTSLTANTGLNTTNPANGNGIISTFKIKIYSGATGSSAKFGTFYGSGTSWTIRDYETIGIVAAGSEQTFSGLNCSVQTNDIIGFCAVSGTGHPYNGTTGSILYYAGDGFSAGAKTYTAYTTSNIWLYGTGETSTGWTGKINGVTNPSKIWGVPVSTISKVGGI